MIPVAKEWNPLQNGLKNLLSSGNRGDAALALGREMHGKLHEREVYGQSGETYGDLLWKDFPESSYRRFSKKDWTPAWNIWHMTRIEELTAHLLMGRVDPVLDESFLARLGTTVRDTGNAMDPESMAAFSRGMNIKALRAYRLAVGKQTRSVLENLAPVDLKSKPRPVDLDRIGAEGGVVEDSVWLIPFWGRKTLGGLMMMPLTRHQVVHINHALRLLESR